MNMNSTAKISFHDHSVNWSDVKAHVDRTHEHYSNKHIDLSKSDHNSGGMIHNIKAESKYRFALFVQLHNLWEISHGHKDRVYKNVHNYFKKTGIQPERNVVIQIGNKKVRRKYYRILRKKGLKDDQIRSIENKALHDTVHEVERKSILRVGYYMTNLDETSAHVHLQVGSLPTVEEARKAVKNAKLSTKQKKSFVHYFIHPVNLTPRGKKWKRRLAHILTDDFKLDTKTAHEFVHHTVMNRPSASFNATLCLMHPEAVNAKGQPDSRKAMHLANLNMSRMAIHNFNKELKKNNLDLHLNLVRTGKVTNLNNDAYEAHEEAKKMIRKKNEVHNRMASEAIDITVKPYFHKATSSINSSISSQSTSIKTASDSIAKKGQSMNESITSASKSFEKSIKAKKSSMASSFNSSAYGGYASALSNGLTKYLPKSNRDNWNWIRMAKGSKAKIKGKPINDPLTFYANFEASRASSASNTYNSTKDKNKSLNDENSSLRDENTGLANSNRTLSSQKDRVKASCKQGLIDLGMPKTKATMLYNNNGAYEGFGKPRKSLLKCVLDKTKQVVKDAKNVAKSIINRAKQRVATWEGINDNGLNAMEDYIRSNNSHAMTRPNDSAKAKGYYDPSDLYGSDFVSAYNDTANQVHDREAQQQRQDDGPQFP